MDVKPTLQAICPRVFPWPHCITSFFYYLLLSRCCDVLYAFCIISFSHRFPFSKGKTMGKRSNKERINDDATTTLRGLQSGWRRVRGRAVRGVSSQYDALCGAVAGLNQAGARGVHAVFAVSSCKT